MLSDLKVLTHHDLEIGGSYLYVCKWLGGQLTLSRIVILSSFDNKGGFSCREYYITDGVERSDEADYCLESIGCPDRPREFCDNHHRLIENTPENLTVLEDLIARKDLIGWLTFLGVENPEEVLIQMKAEEKAFDAMVADAMAADYDGIGQQNLEVLNALLESKLVTTVKH